MWFFHRIGAMVDGTRSKKAEGVHGKSFDQNVITMWLTLTTMRRGPRRLEGERTPDDREKKGGGKLMDYWWSGCCCCCAVRFGSLGNLRFD